MPSGHQSEVGAMKTAAISVPRDALIHQPHVLLCIYCVPACEVPDLYGRNLRR